MHITKRLIPDNFDILAVKSNIHSFEEFTLVDFGQDVNKADIVVFLVSHKEFNDLKIEKSY